MSGARRPLIVCLALVLAGIAPSAGEIRTGQGWEVRASPFRLTFLDGKRVLTSQTPDSPGPGGRMSYALADGSRHGLTRLLKTRRGRDATTYLVATDEGTRTARVVLTRKARGLRVDWTLHPAAGVAQMFEALTAGAEQHFLGGGAHGLFVDLKARVVDLKVKFIAASFTGSCVESGTPVPFFASSAGYGIGVASTAIGRFAFPGARDLPRHPACQSDQSPCPVGSFDDRIQICVKDSALSYEVYAGSPAAVISRYSALAGRPALPPPAQFGLIKWRDEVEGQSEVVDDVVQMQRRRIPITSVLLDNPWELRGCVGTLRFDPQRFPAPQRMIDSVHAHGVRFMLWIAPFYSAESGCPPPDYPRGSFVDGRNIVEGAPPPFGSFLPPPPLDIDFSSARAAAHYIKKLMAVLAMGVDGVKADRGDETDFEKSRFAGGSGLRLHNRYPVLYQEVVRRALRDARRALGRDPNDFTSMFRSGYAGSQAVIHGWWAADQNISYEGLRIALRNELGAAASGFPVIGSDVGGYSSGLISDLSSDSGSTTTDRLFPSQSLFLRWAQIGAISPLMEVGGRGRQQQFWNEYDAATVDAFRRFAVLHYELFPYFMELSRRAASTGVPILRPLAFSFPRDEDAWTHDLELMVGPDILAAPVIGEEAELSDGVNATPAPVYLPQGSWVDLFTGEVIGGGQTVVRLTPITEMPLYVRTGTAVPYNLREPDVWSERWRVADLDRPGRVGWMYAPGARGTEVTTHAAGAFRARVSKGAHHLSLAGAPPEVQVLVLTRSVPRSVAIDGRRIRQTPSLRALRAMRYGWIASRGAFGGIVIKLAPREGRSRIDLALR